MADTRQFGQMSFNRMCDGCRGNAPQMYCECTGNRIYLCGTCIISHIGKNPTLRHELIPAEIEVSNIFAYRERSDALTKGKKELEENLAKIDQCCEELKTLVEEIVWALTEYLDYQLSQLRILKATLSLDIAKSVKEAEFALGYDTKQLLEKYSEHLRYYEKDNLMLFDYEISPIITSFCLHHMPKFTLLSPGQYRKQLFRLGPNQVEAFDFETERWGRSIHLVDSIKVDIYSAFTQVDTNHLFCCGQDPIPSVTSMSHVDYLIDVITGSVEELPPLSVARNSSGVLHYEGEIFVFGSNSNTDYHFDQTRNQGMSRKEVEMMQLTTRKWYRLPDMPTGRCSFTPCVHIGNVYLCYGNDTFIDILEVKTRRFLNPLPITLPQESNCNSVTIVIGDELIVISYNNTTVFSLLSRTSTLSQKHNEIKTGPASAPIKYGNLLYWVDYGGNCVRASGEKYEILELVGI